MHSNIVDCKYLLSDNQLPTYCIMEKLCLDCGALIKGRTDKKFCSDPCRNGFNNRLNSCSTNYLRNVNNILRRNRRILEELVDLRSVKCSRSKLLAMGFDFSYFTHYYTSPKGRTYHFCYEFGYLYQKNDCFLLIKKTNNVV